MATNKGRLDAVMFGKILDSEQRKALVWDVGRGHPIRLLMSLGSHVLALADGIIIRLYMKITVINRPRLLLSYLLIL